MINIKDLHPNKRKINSDNYHEKYMKVKFNLHDDLPSEKTLELCNIVILQALF